MGQVNMGSERAKKTGKKMLRSLDDLMTPEQVAKKLHVSIRTLRRYSNVGVRGIKLQSVPIGPRLVRYDENDVRLFIELTQKRDLANA